MCVFACYHLLYEMGKQHIPIMEEIMSSLTFPGHSVFVACFYVCYLTLTVLVTTIDALQHFETG